MPSKMTNALSAALGSLPFPISKEAAIARIGDTLVPSEHDVPVPLGNVLRGVPCEGFQDYLHASRLVDERWARIARNLAEVERAERASLDAPARRQGHGGGGAKPPHADR